MLWTSRFALIIVIAGLIGCNTSTEESSSSKIQGALLSNQKEMPDTLAATNLFFDGNPNLPMDLVQEYEVKLPLWSDGAHKKRYVFVPAGSSIHYDQDTHSYKFPQGTTFIKQFNTGADPEQKIETRVITMKDDGKWHFVTYVWDDNGGNAANTRPKKVTKGGTDYRIPSEQECQMCHGDPATILGFRPEQLNFTASNGANMLATLSNRNLFDNTAEELQKAKPIDDPHDESLSIEARTRAYMAVNCSSCHNPNGPEKANLMDLRLESADTKLVSEGKLIPGDLENSIVWQRMNAETDRMPLITLRSDPFGLELMKNYITSMKKD